MKTAIITSESSEKHITGDGHPEQPKRVVSIIDTLKKNKELLWDKPDVVPNDILNMTHSEDYINNLNLTPGIKILDAGVGSGCIGASLAKVNPKTIVYGLDYSFDAIQVANINKKKLELDNFYLINSKWLNSLKENTFNIVVSNPPYVAPFDPHLDKLKHEPISALVANKNGLEDFDIISFQAMKVIKDNGLLAFEHGNNQSNEVKKIMTRYGFKDINLINDYQSQPRITIGRK